MAEPAAAKFASLIVFVPEINESLRFCIDLHVPNAAILHSSYSITRMAKRFDLLSEVKIFPALDASLGYWQIEMGDSVAENTALVTHFGLIKFKTMLFGLKNVRITFWCVMDVLLAFAKWKHASVYIDDFTIFFQERQKSTRSI